MYPYCKQAAMKYGRAIYLFIAIAGVTDVNGKIVQIGSIFIWWKNSVQKQSLLPNPENILFSISCDNWVATITENYRYFRYVIQIDNDEQSGVSGKVFSLTSWGKQQESFVPYSNCLANKFKSGKYQTKSHMNTWKPSHLSK